MRLVTSKQKGTIVFVGDTHGDVQASQQIIKKTYNQKRKFAF